jgi:hypothetical protein
VRERDDPALTCGASDYAGSFAASRSTGSMRGGSARSSPALAISAAAMGPLMCALRAVSSGKASKMPNSVFDRRKANHATVPCSFWASASAP